MTHQTTIQAKTHLRMMLAVLQDVVRMEAYNRIPQISESIKSDATQIMAFEAMDPLMQLVDQANEVIFANAQWTPKTL